MGNEIEISEQEIVWTALAWHIYKNEIPPEDWEMEKVDWCRKYRVSLPPNKVIKRLISEFEKEFETKNISKEKTAKEPNYISYLKNKGIKYFNYITYASNLIISYASKVRGILVEGILSRNMVQRYNIPHKDISYKSVQNLRKNIWSDIHEYVPLYFATHTPMLYDVYNKSDDGKFIVIIKIDLRIFEKRAFFTDMNAAYKECNFYTRIEDLENLKWDIINKRKCYSKQYKKYKQAELLIRKKVPPFYFRKIIFSNEDVMNEYKRIIKWESRKVGSLKNYLNKMLVDQGEFNWD